MPTAAQAIEVVTVKSYQWKGVTRKTSNKWHFSGVAIADLPTATNLAQAIARIELEMMSPAFSTVMSEAYITNPGSTKADFIYQFPITWTPTNDAYGAPAGLQECQQPEVCIMLDHQDGVDDKGRKVYCRKWIHFVSQLQGNPGAAPGFTSAFNTTLATLTSGGIGEHNWLTTDPKGNVLTGTWVASPYLRTRQLRKGGKQSGN